MPDAASGTNAGRRVVVVSPHLDDAVISVGATIAGAARSGMRVEVLTVFACDPDSTTPTMGWDSRAGFAIEGQAARARREEDARACEEVGATPTWLSFGSVDYERHGDEADVRIRVAEAIAGADEVLLPGAPLTHPDHAWLVRLLVTTGLRCGRIGFYAEQPYAWRSQDAAGAPDWLEDALTTNVTFGRVRARTREWLAKRRAIRRYRSQLPLLALSGLAVERLLWSEARAGGEAVAWLPASVPSGQA
jgi:LmbE family N-acetylglucosaminyl deacetylase